MEDQAMSMVIRGGEMAMRLTKEGAKMAMQLLAAVKALSYKIAMRGQVSLKLLQKQSDTEAFAVRRDKLEDFRAGAKEINMIYAVTDHANPDYVTVVVRQADIGNFNHIVEERGLAETENDCKKTDVPNNAKDEGIITPEDTGKEYYTFTLSENDGVAFQRAAAVKNLILATTKDIGALTSLLKKNEVLKESITAAVEKNKDASYESRLVYEKFWPMLSKKENLETIKIDIDSYTDFKHQATANKVLFTPVPSGEKMQIVYAAEDRAAVLSFISERPEIKKVVSRAELEARQAKAVEAGDQMYIIQDDQLEAAQAVMHEVGIEKTPEFTKVMKSDRFYEDVNHRIERVKYEMSERSGLTQEIHMERNVSASEPEYYELNFSSFSRNEFITEAKNNGLSFVESRDDLSSDFIIPAAQQEQLKNTVQKIGFNPDKILKDKKKRNEMPYWNKNHGAELDKLEMKYVDRMKDIVGRGGIER